MSIIQRFIYNIFLYWWRILYIIGLYIPVKEVILRTFKDDDNEYIIPLEIRFLDTFKQTKINYNENIESIFYDKTNYNNCVKISKNLLEKIWSSRILFENTPRGNIIMLYNPYKLGFSFFCDQKVISYDVLNAVAMKYVSIYRCRDFFMDEKITPSEHTSKLISIHFYDDIKRGGGDKKDQDKNNKKIFFANFRDYSKENPNSKRPLLPVEVEKRKNIFLYLGKTHNFNILQEVSKPRKIFSDFTSPMLENLEKDSGIKREVFSYKNYKKATNEKTINPLPDT